MNENAIERIILTSVLPAVVALASVSASDLAAREPIGTRATPLGPAHDDVFGGQDGVMFGATLLEMQRAAAAISQGPLGTLEPPVLQQPKSAPPPRSLVGGVRRSTLGSQHRRVVRFAPWGPNVIRVNTLDDELNEDGDCSLREAIEAANRDVRIDDCRAGDGADTIHLLRPANAGTYSLSIPGRGEDGNRTGDLDVRDDLRLRGNGHGSRIDGAGLDRVLDVHPGLRVLVENVAITGGDVTGLGDDEEDPLDPVRFPDADEGGGVLVRGSTVDLRDVVLRDNRAGDGGGLSSVAGHVALEHCSVLDNEATAGDGGGLRQHGGLGGASLTISGSLLIGNLAGDGVPGDRTYAGGGAVASAAAPAAGGGPAELVIEDCELRDNSAESGGAVRSENASVHVARTTFEGNRASHIGGALRTLVRGTDGHDLTIEDSLFSKNEVIIAPGAQPWRTGQSRRFDESFGGAVAVGVIDAATTAQLDRCLFIGNQAQGNTGSKGGAVALFGHLARATLTLNDCTVSGNVAGSGGGLATLGNSLQPAGLRLRLTRCTVTDNRADDDLAVLEQTTGGGVMTYSTSALVVDSTISNNVAAYDPDRILRATSLGGGWFHNQWFKPSGLTFVNTTISGNRAPGNSVNSGAGGGVIGTSTSRVPITFINCTLADNESGGGGAVGLIFQQTVVFENTIVSGNVATVRDDGCFKSVGLERLTSLGHNVEDGDTCQLWEPTDVLHANARLGPLADNGGRTWTRALLPDSPAIDMGNDATCQGLLVGGLDQRGVVRPQGDHCDAGAFEWRPEDAP